MRQFTFSVPAKGPQKKFEYMDIYLNNDLSDLLSWVELYDKLCVRYDMCNAIEPSTELRNKFMMVYD